MTLIRRALVSVSDKTGLERLAKYLDENKVRMKKLFGLDGNLERALVDAKETIERKRWCWWC